MNHLSRRGVLVGGLAVAGLAAFPQKPVLGDPSGEPIRDRIEALQRRHNMKIGVYGVDLDSGRTVSYLMASRSPCVRRSRATPPRASCR